MVSYKNRFPFKIGTTSYILPVKEESVVANVVYLKDSFDLVQLLFFGREYLDEVMSPRIIKELKAIKDECGLCYTIHLPSDLELLNPSAARVEESIGVIEKIMAETEILDVDGYVLHIDALVKGSPAVELDHEHFNLFHRALDTLSAKLAFSSRNILIENTTYDLTFFSSLIVRSRCSVCMDAGHISLYNHDYGRFIEVFQQKIRQVHLHGVSGGRDHQALTGLDAVSAGLFNNFLKDYTGSVIIEVYNLKDLVKSGEFIDRFCK
jgi:sugar phosphate isomerase/epimerase